MQMSVDRGSLGVSLFALGYQDDQVWDDIAAISATLTTEPAGSETTTATTTTAPTTTAAPTTTTAAARRDHDHGRRLSGGVPG